MTRALLVAAALSLFLPGRGVMSQGIDVAPPADQSSGERELRALASAYPDRISDVASRDGDWAVNVDGQWFSWAHGRILPDSERADWETYSRFRFYPYPPGYLPPLPVLDDESKARLKNAMAASRTRPPARSETFLERLYDASGRAATTRHMTAVDFLGFHVQVHERIAGPLAAAAQEIQAASKQNPQVAAFLRGLSEVDGFNYRDVAGTRTRSYHSYGLAVDLIPRSYGGKTPYWLWASGSNDEWWSIPFDRRWMVPPEVVAAFERQGFVWGGKWLFFDMMHFEYRPEILILSHGE